MTRHDKKAQAAPARAFAAIPDGAVLAARLAAGALLVYSGALKASAPAEEFAVVIETYQLLPPGSATTLAALLPWAEILLGWALLLGWMTRAAAAGAAGLFGMFVLALLSTKARGIDLPNCGCFGGVIMPKPSVMIVIDLVLLGLAVLAFRRGPAGPSLDNWSTRPHN